MPDQDLTDIACHNTCLAMRAESFRADQEQRSQEACLIPAAALEAMQTKQEELP